LLFRLRREIILMSKVMRIFVNSAELPKAGYSIGSTNAELATHGCCDPSKASTALSGSDHIWSSDGNRILSEEEQQAIIVVEDFCKKKGFKLEIIDVGTKGAISKLRFKMKGLGDFPVISFRDEAIHGIPTEQMLRELIK
jgi:hypothetical protein